MHIGRFKYNRSTFYGLVEGDTVRELNNDIYHEFSTGSKEYQLKNLIILPPSHPAKVVLVGLNYRDHAKELNFSIPEEPVIFIKPSTTVIGPGEPILYPDISRQVEYEAELAFLIKKECYRVKQENAGEYILGYTCLNDVTARDIQKKDGQWTRAKGFDTFCPVGPFIYIPAKDFDPHNLRIRAILNRETRQDSNTNNLIFNINYLVQFISSVMRLFPGDIISTGTPAGVGPMQPGDEITVEIEKVGKLVNPVVKAGK
ncbi:MAG: fumarylacetoacetate hydrolase family protein [bacterium]|nr:fumarylacetoacetate hydrolase family protein [bacterium]